MRITHEQKDTYKNKNASQIYQQCTAACTDFAWVATRCSRLFLRIVCIAVGAFIVPSHLHIIFCAALPSAPRTFSHRHVHHTRHRRLLSLLFCSALQSEGVENQSSSTQFIPQLLPPFSFLHICPAADSCRHVIFQRPRWRLEEGLP